MDILLALVLFVLGLFGGVLSGLLGIGGGIIMVPLLLYVPPLAGLAPFTMKVVAGITTVQSFTAGVSGTIGHNRFKRVDKRLVFYIGIPMAFAAFAGSFFSQHLSDNFLLITFAAMAIASSLLMLIPKRNDSDADADDNIEFNKLSAVIVGAVIGVLSGIIGQGGAFLYLPAMLYLLQIPTRITIGSGLAIGVIASSSVLLGRVGTDQIPWLSALVLVTGVIIGAQMGSIFSQKIPRIILRRLLAVVVLGVAVKIVWEVAVSFNMDKVIALTG